MEKNRCICKTKKINLIQIQKLIVSTSENIIIQNNQKGKRVKKIVLKRTYHSISLSQSNRPETNNEKIKEIKEKINHQFLTFDNHTITGLYDSKK